MVDALTMGHKDLLARTNFIYVVGLVHSVLSGKREGNEEFNLTVEALNKSFDSQSSTLLTVPMILSFALPNFVLIS